MFSNLVESGSHLKDLKRRSSFFIGTLVFYSVLLAAAGVGSIYAYNIHLDEQTELELQTMLRFAPPPAPAEAERPRQIEPRRAATESPGRGAQQVAVIQHLVSNNPNLSNRSVAPPNAPELPPGTLYRIGNHVSIPTGTVGVPDPNAANPGAGRVSVVPPETEEAPERRVEAQPKSAQETRPRAPLNLSTGVISGKAVNKPMPAYPDIAKKAGAAGTVPVQIVVDEQGRVISAQATGGHPLLRKAAVEAAYRARFTPTLLSNQPIKVTGVINYNFVLN